ncbi:MAG TPA: DoxX family protein [Flavobacteriales bacterium]|nr:DoxX family protein [Flavobacteriales bacterium]
MKKLNLTYWIVTALFSAFMLFSSFGGITLMPEAVAMLHDHLGYPLYFIQLVSWAKVIGAIAILLPKVPPRVKEWAYFGFFIDLVAAIISFIAVGDPVMAWAPVAFRSFLDRSLHAASRTAQGYQLMTNTHGTLH